RQVTTTAPAFQSAICPGQADSNDQARSRPAPLGVTSSRNLGERQARVAGPAAHDLEDEMGLVRPLGVADQCVICLVLDERQDAVFVARLAGESLGLSLPFHFPGKAPVALEADGDLRVTARLRNPGSFLLPFLAGGGGRGRCGRGRGSLARSGAC